MKNTPLILVLLALLPAVEGRADSYTVTVNYPWALLANHLDSASNRLRDILPEDVCGSSQPSRAFRGSLVWIPREAPKGYIVIAPGKSNSIPFSSDLLARFGRYDMDELDCTWSGGRDTVMHAGDGILKYYGYYGATQFTFTGTPRIPSGRQVQIPAGASYLLCAETVTNGTYEIVVGKSPVEGSQVYRLNPYGDAGHFGPPDYNVYTFSSGAWTPEPPVLNIGEAAWFRAPPPALGLVASNGNAVLSWPTNSIPFVLESATQSGPGSVWSVVAAPVETNAALQTVTLPFSAAENRYFRLRY